MTTQSRHARLDCRQRRNRKTRIRKVFRNNLDLTKLYLKLARLQALRDKRTGEGE